jgi:peptidoglycan/LPS O-acetylase OafA/YrhL
MSHHHAHRHLTATLVSHKNNFDLLRFAFAFIVFLYHSHILSGNPHLAGLSHWLSADFAVESFFVISGFLVFMSYENSASVTDYFSKRVRRIYPAYFAVVMVAALGGALITSLPLGEYFSSAWLRYVVANLSFLNFLTPELPGVFQGNRVHAVNGALWTLKIEVMFYVSVPVIAIVCARFGRWQVLATLYVFSVAYALGMDYFARETGRELYMQLGRQLPGQLSYFLAGAACYYFLPFFARYWRWGFLAGLAVLLLPLPRVLETLLVPAALGIFVTFLAVGGRYLGNFGRYGDFSYGIYIIHFPVIQTLVAFGVFNGNPYAAVGFAAVTVLAGAHASWHLVEKPFLRKSSHYVVAKSSLKQA